MTFISRTAVESDLAAGRLVEARVEGLDATREISLASRHGACPDAGRGRVRRICATAARGVIVRWGLEELDPLLAELGIGNALLVTSTRFAELELPVGSSLHGGPPARPARRRRGRTGGCGGGGRTRRRGWRERNRHREGGVGGNGPSAGRRAHDVRGVRVDLVLRNAGRGASGEDRRSGRAHTVAIVYEPATHAGLAARRVGRDGDERARTLRGGAVRRAVRGRDPRSLS